MGFWKKLGGFLGRTAVQAGIGALEAKASGKPITIGTVGPGVLNEELKRISNETSPPEVVEIWEGEHYPPSVREGTLSVAFFANGHNGKNREHFRKFRYFADVEAAQAFAESKNSVVRVAEEIGGRLEWVLLPPPSPERSE